LPGSFVPFFPIVLINPQDSHDRPSYHRACKRANSNPPFSNCSLSPPFQSGALRESDGNAFRCIPLIFFSLFRHQVKLRSSPFCSPRFVVSLTPFYIRFRAFPPQFYVLCLDCLFVLLPFFPNFCTGNGPIERLRSLRRFFPSAALHCAQHSPKNHPFLLIVFYVRLFRGPVLLPCYRREPRIHICPPFFLFVSKAAF